MWLTCGAGELNAQLGFVFLLHSGFHSLQTFALICVYLSLKAALSVLKLLHLKGFRQLWQADLFRPLSPFAL